MFSSNLLTIKQSAVKSYEESEESDARTELGGGGRSNNSENDLGGEEIDDNGDIGYRSDSWQSGGGRAPSTPSPQQRQRGLSSAVIHNSPGKHDSRRVPFKKSECSARAFPCRRCVRSLLSSKSNGVCLEPDVGGACFGCRSGGHACRGLDDIATRQLARELSDLAVARQGHSEVN